MPILLVFSALWVTPLILLGFLVWRDLVRPVLKERQTSVPEQQVVVVAVGSMGSVIEWDEALAADERWAVIEDEWLEFVESLPVVGESS